MRFVRDLTDIRLCANCGAYKIESNDKFGETFTDPLPITCDNSHLQHKLSYVLGARMT